MPVVYAGTLGRPRVTPGMYFRLSGGVYVFLTEIHSRPLGFLWGWAMFWTMHSGILAARLDRKRKKKTSNNEWTNPHDPDAKVTKMKDGRTHLAHKAEHAVDVGIGAIVAVTLQGADQGDTTTIVETATPPPSRSKTRKPASRTAGVGRDRGRQGFAAIKRWSTSTPCSFDPILRSPIGADEIGRRRPTRRRRCTGIVAGFAAAGDGA